MEWTAICIQKLTNVSLQTGYAFLSNRSTQLALELPWDTARIKNATNRRNLIYMILENTFQQKAFVETRFDGNYINLQTVKKTV